MCPSSILCTEANSAAPPRAAIIENTAPHCAILARRQERQHVKIMSRWSFSSGVFTPTVLITIKCSHNHPATCRRTTVYPASGPQSAAVTHWSFLLPHWFISSQLRLSQTSAVTLSHLKRIEHRWPRDSSTHCHLRKHVQMVRTQHKLKRAMEVATKNFSKQKVEFDI